MSLPQSIQKSVEAMLSRGHARRLGRVENFFAICQRQDLYKNFSMISTFNHKINSKPLLYHALRSMMLKNSMICTTIADTDHSDLTKPRPQTDYVKILDQLKYKDVFLDLGDKSLDDRDELLNEINDIVLPYGHGNPLWKLAILDDNTLCYISNHCSSDGITAKHFFQDLVHELNEIDESSLPQEDQYDEKLLIDYEQDKSIIPAIPMPLESIVSHKPPLWYYPEFIFNILFIKKFSSRRESTPNSKHHLRSINITSEELSEIKKFIKPHGITLTPYILSTWLWSQYQSGFLTQREKFTDSLIAVDTRHYIPNAIEKNLYKYGLHACSFHTFFRKPQSFNWKSIEKFSEYTKWVVSTGRALYRLGFSTSETLAQKKNMDALLKKIVTQSPKGNTMFSNSGVMLENYKDNGKCKVVDSWFSQNMNGTYFLFTLNTVSTKENGLNIVINTAQQEITNDQFDKLAKIFRENLINGCNS